MNKHYRYYRCIIHFTKNQDGAEFNFGGAVLDEVKASRLTCILLLNMLGYLVDRATITEEFITDERKQEND